MKRASCKGAAHPSTGHAWSEKTLICRNCTVSFFRWLQSHTSDRPRKKNGKVQPSFYDAALRKEP